MLANKLMGGAEEEKLYVDDVFSTYLYTGNGSTQTINNGIDLAGKGGLVWLKSRNNSNNHSLFDTNRGVLQKLESSTTGASVNDANTLTSFNSSGFSLGSGESNAVNSSGSLVSSWTFLKASKFFDVVTYTGIGSTAQMVAHNLGVQPGFIVIKRIDGAGEWAINHRGNGGTSWVYRMSLNTNAGGATGIDFGTSHTSSVFSPALFYTSSGVGHAYIQPGAQYVAYLFAHDPSPEGIIQCGSYTTDGSGNGTFQNLGWEPQWVMVKAATGTAENWVINDNMRGMLANPVGSANALFTNTSGAEVDYGIGVNLGATGFTGFGSASRTYIYLAIRRPNKPPTSGTEVFLVNQAAALPNMINPQRSTDMVLTRLQRDTNTSQVWLLADRLRSRFCAPTSTTVPTLETNSTAAETTYGSGNRLLAAAPYSVQISGSGPQISYLFSRAPGFMDVVCYRGNSVNNREITHNLQSNNSDVLVIVKSRNVGAYWAVGAITSGSSTGLALNSADMQQSVLSDGRVYPISSNAFALWNNLATTFNAVNTSGVNYVAYVFGTLSGVSKVGSYVGNGSNLTVNCGFTSGARFVLVKKIAKGSGDYSLCDWYVWDTSRGIVSANDPHLSLNTTAAEVTTDDSVDPDTSGFIVNQNTATNINVSGSTYIFLAIA